MLHLHFALFQRTVLCGKQKELAERIEQHQQGEGAKYTKKYLPVELVYYEEFQRIDEAYLREQQVKGWNRKKKEALINNQLEQLPELSKSKSSDSE